MGKKIAVKDASEVTQDAEMESQPKEPRLEEEKTPEENPVEEMTKAELKEELKKTRETSEKNYDLFLRSQAEIENIKKRNAKEKEEWIQYSNEKLIKEILPVMDNLEKAIAHSQNEVASTALREGVELTLKGLKDILRKAGLEEVPAEGEAFDPNFHHAVSEMTDAGQEPGTILLELQKGYRLHQRLIRPALVVVNKSKSQE